jgi:hypothetical protein
MASYACGLRFFHDDDGADFFRGPSFDFASIGAEPDLDRTVDAAFLNRGVLDRLGPP